MTDIQYDRYSLILNGKRSFIRSGAIHYFRLPSQHLWKDRLYKLKAAGYNTVDIYFNWGFHSENDGEYDFSGIRDVRLLLQIAKGLGLWVIARPGPYINAEVSGGGFPMWLLAKKDLPLRNRRAGQMVWSDEYMAYVRQWWEQILPIVNEFDNVLMVQIENEYSTLEVEPDYMQALYQMARDLGVKVPLSHNDLFIAGLYEDIVDLYAFDNYSVTQFESDWRKLTGVFSVLDNIESNLRPFCQNRPLIAAELQAGWFGMWKGSSYIDITESLGREHINLSTKTVISQGLTVFNHYKAIGGTNWAHIGSTETYTSYDFGAPISEVGINTIRLFEAKSLNYLLESFRLYATNPVETTIGLPFQIKNTEKLLMARKNIETEASPNTYWMFLRNLNEQIAQTELTIKFSDTLSKTVPLEIAPHGFSILPQNFLLDCGLTLAYTNAEPIYQNKDYLILKASSNTQIGFQSEKPLSLISSNVLHTGSIQTQEMLVHDQHVIHLAESALGEKELSACIVSDGTYQLTVLMLGQYWADRFWQDQDLLSGTMILGADTLLDASNLSVEKHENGLYYLQPDGLIKATPLTPPQKRPQLPELKDWSFFDAAPELETQTSFRPINQSGLDLDANQQYEGSAWYSLSLGKSKPKQIQLDAAHLWSVYLNGHLLSHGHSLTHINEETENPLVEVSLPDKYFQTENNTILIFIDSLGHPKGFHDDQQEAQGLLKLLIDNTPLQETGFKLSFSGGLANEKAVQLTPLQETPNTPLVYATTTFNLPDLSGWDVSIGFNLSTIDTERVNIYLNKVLIGRYWDACQAQSSFYLPAGLLKMQAGEINEIGLLFMDFDMQHNKDAWVKMLSKEQVAFLNFYKADPTFPCA